MPNAELAYRVLDHIKANPEEWDQSFWASKRPCGTVACFAGWTVILGGYELDWKQVPGGNPQATSVVDPSGVTRRIPARAEGLLGIWLDPWVDEGLDLFHMNNTMEDLERIVYEIFGPRPEPVAE